ncbi:GTP-binding protein Era [Desulfobaculum xiamenense]|uniref:GTPase Era n=1 Tax=Desulfobaculum xiamenense TaxID=995050 RepID=A0A846QTI3_9BACT|nr:GTPase Era [Desulfobaculum xiamenense]NJB67939.1 GTP-binding protein Era [Desulfobaculum xiamenense]
MTHRFGTVVLLGPPNAGKSTLLNGILGQKVAIVSPKPQTTRNQITGILTDPDAQIMFLDTPGVHRLSGRMNRFLLQAAWNAAESADVMVVMADADLYAKKPYLLEKEMQPLVKRVAGTQQPVFLALNKIDLVKDKAALLPLMQFFSSTWPNAEIIPVSAATNEGVDRLLASVKQCLPECPPMFPEDQVSTVPLRFMASETIREKLFLGLRHELPYTTAVEIEEWSEDDHMVTISAVIYVTRDNHKAMVIGKGGQNLKDIGQKARKELKTLIEKKVHLELWVKVRSGWTEDVSFLQAIGLTGGMED